MKPSSSRLINPFFSQLNNPNISSHITKYSFIRLLNSFYAFLLHCNIFFYLYFPPLFSFLTLYGGKPPSSSRSVRPPSSKLLCRSKHRDAMRCLRQQLNAYAEPSGNLPLAEINPSHTYQQLVNKTQCRPS